MVVGVIMVLLCEGLIIYAGFSILDEWCTLAITSIWWGASSVRPVIPSTSRLMMVAWSSVRIRSSVNSHVTLTFRSILLRFPSTKIVEQEDSSLKLVGFRHISQRGSKFCDTLVLGEGEHFLSLPFTNIIQASQKVFESPNNYTDIILFSKQNICVMGQ